MQITLMHHTPLYIAAHGARTCWDSGDKSDTVIDPFETEPPVCGTNDKALIDRVGNKFKHKSILEHVSYNFFIEGVSRALLQELARHRIASYSVKSSRYTLKELRDEESFNLGHLPTYDATMLRAQKYLVFTGNPIVDEFSVQALENLRTAVVANISNDIAKYCLPEAYKTTVQWSINARSLQNFLFLRTDKSALWEIQNLAHAVYDALPADHQYLFTDYVHQSN